MKRGIRESFHPQKKPAIR